MHKRKLSLKNGFLSIIVICWLAPLVVVVALAGMLLGDSYQESARQELDATAKYAMAHVRMHLDEAIYDSKNVSYDGLIENAYRQYLQTGDSAALYRETNGYLYRNFSRERRYKASFVCFNGLQTAADVYTLNSGLTGCDLLQECQRKTPQILQSMENADTQTRFMILDGNLYLARNLLDTDFNQYATFVMMLNPAELFQPLEALTRISNVQMCLDGAAFSTDPSGSIIPDQTPCDRSCDAIYTVELDDHSFRLLANIAPYDVWAENPWLYAAILILSVMVLPLLVVVIVLFRRHVTEPMQNLLQAHQLVEAGSRGFTIDCPAPNEEFGEMYQQFNNTSAELKRQFDRSYLEQQAAQKAQIKALQSQINPHFLNNTLEIINWEARLANNTRVSAMIEALSTMLGAALDRHGTAKVPLSEELGYVDAYLYIIQERLGEGFRVYKQVEPDTLACIVPRLILQPIAENAVEHDITARHGGSLWVRSLLHGQVLVLEVEHDGTLTPEDQQNIRQLLSDQAENHRVGIHNVYQRLRLIYGMQGSLSIEQTERGTILARICIPADTGQSEGGCAK